MITREREERLQGREALRCAARANPNTGEVREQTREVQVRSCSMEQTLQPARKWILHPGSVLSLSPEHLNPFES